MSTLFAIIGDPVAQVRSPRVFNRLFIAHGVAAVMVPFKVHSTDVGRVLDMLLALQNLEGVLVTVPHKFSAARCAVRLSARAEIALAVNALRRVDDGWEGDLFDGEGFAIGAAACGIELRGRRAAIIGAGGAGSAIAMALLERDVATLNVFDIDGSKGLALAARLGGHYGRTVVLAPPDKDCDLVINATPLGMRTEDPLPIDIESLGRHAIVADVIMEPPVTPLLQNAAARGHRTLEGRYMLDGQVNAIWRFFRLPGADQLSSET